MEERGLGTSVLRSLKHYRTLLSRGRRQLSSTSKIEWTDATWNPVPGCKKISPGCKHCYAAGFAHRLRSERPFPFAPDSLTQLAPAVERRLNFKYQEPVKDIRVRMRIPVGMRVREAILKSPGEAAQQRLEFSVADGIVSLRVPQLNAYVLILFRMEAQ